MVAGSVLAAVAAVWISTLPSMNTLAGLQHSQDAKALEENLIAQSDLSPNEPETSIDTTNLFINTATAPRRPEIENLKGQKFHIVNNGETLSDISYKYYKSPNKWQKILDANRNAIKNANKVKPGTKLIIPD